MLRNFKNISIILIVISLLTICSNGVFAHHYTIPGGETPTEVPEDANDPNSPYCSPEECITPGTANDPTSSDEDICTGGEPVYLYNGSFYYRHTDLVLRGRIPIVIRRSYDTRSEFKGLMGYGWSLNYHIRLFTRKDGSLLLKRGDNSKIIFRKDSGNAYKSTNGYDTLIANQDGTFTLDKPDGYTYNFDIDGCLSSISNRNGNQLLFSYDTDPDDVKLLHPFSGTSPYAVTSTPVTLGYDFRLMRIDEATNDVITGRYVEFAYNDDGRISTIKDSSDRIINYQYDPNQNGDLLSYVDAEGNPYNYTYDANHLMVTFVGLGCSDCSLHTNTYNNKKQVIQQRHGNNLKEFEYLENRRTIVTTHIYNDETLEKLNTRHEYYDFDDKGRTIKFTRQVGVELDEDPNSIEDNDVVNQYVYNTQGRMTQHINPRGVKTDYSYHPAFGTLLSETTHIPESNDRVMITYEYGSNINKYTGRTISSTLESQVYRTQYTYDNNGNELTESKFADSDDPATAITKHYAYDVYGNVISVTDPMGNVTAYEYDEYGFMTREYDPANPKRQTLYVKDSRGNVLSTTDARGNTTTFEYDNLNRLIKTTDPLGCQAVYSYSGANLTKMELGKTTSAQGRISFLTYDSTNRLTAIEMLNNDGIRIVISQFIYDSEGKIISKIDGNGNITFSQYDEIGRKISVTNPLGYVTLFSYDKASNYVAITDAELNSTYYKYDYANRLTETINGLGYTTQYNYNALGKQIKVIDARNNTTTKTYDDAGRLLRVVNPLGKTTAYIYDKNDNILAKITPNEFSDPTGTDAIRYSYDVYNQLIQKNYPDETFVRFQYDLVGNLIQWYDGNFSGSTTYDKLNRPLSITTNYPHFSKEVEYTYNRFGQRATMVDGENQVTTYRYGNNGLMQTILHPHDFITTYDYDQGGRLRKKILPNNVMTEYTYDISNRLTELVNVAPGGKHISSYSYTYDNIGNRLSMTTLEGNHTYIYDEVGQLISAIHPSQPEEMYQYDTVGNRILSADTDDWTYDNGNRPLHYGEVNFTYDDNGNTISKTEPSGMTTFTYDYEDRMVSANNPSLEATYVYNPFGKRLSKSIDSETVYYLYDREDIIAVYDASGNLRNGNYHGQDIDEPIAMISGNDAFFYTFDGLGSVSELTDLNGIVTENLSYDSFGALSGNQVSNNNYSFTAREQDFETGLYYFRARYYDPVTGRFLSEDPLGLNAGINLYIYALNNPIRYTDPTGLQPTCCNPPSFANCSSNCMGDCMTQLGQALGLGYDFHQDFCLRAYQSCAVNPSSPICIWGHLICAPLEASFGASCSIMCPIICGHNRCNKFPTADLPDIGQAFEDAFSSIPDAFSRIPDAFDWQDFEDAFGRIPDAFSRIPDAFRR
ncbi:RHS repeat-associated core domain-containing protein [Planctomycetota bacterium]